VDIEEVLTRGVSEILPSKENLKKTMDAGRITLYQGFDASMPSLHLGNLVGLIKLRQFQKLGHKVIFLVGDFTGMIGDPTDKAMSRKQLKREEVTKNSENWKEQAARVLEFEGDNPATILYNSQWNDKISFYDLVSITSNFTVQQMLERDMFQNRLKKNEPIYLSEFLYPVAQGIDSLQMGVDLEVGGTDQVFNMLAGRTLLKAMKGKEKYVLATKLLVDKEGNKVGKTTGNALFLDSSPENFYAGIMSFPDETIVPGFELLTELPMQDVSESASKDPMGTKKKLAFEIVKMLWGEENAKTSQTVFETTFQEKKPEYSQEIEIRDGLAQTIAPYNSMASLSEAKRLIAAGAVEINGKVVKDPNQKISLGDEIKVGKKTFLKVK